MTCQVDDKAIIYYELYCLFAKSWMKVMKQLGFACKKDCFLFCSLKGVVKSCYVWNKYFEDWEVMERCFTEISTKQSVEL